MKIFSMCLFLLAFSQASLAAATCQTLQSEDADFQVLREGNVLTQKNWKEIDVIVNFDRRECLSAVDQELIKVNGQLLWRFTTSEDRCDGGNTYGSIYSYDLKTPIAHIYDGDVYCEDMWNEDERASNHKCDLAAEKLAKKKMSEFGLNLVNTSSTLEIRKPYIYSFIKVHGTIKNKGNKEATVRVLTNIDSCKFGGVSIENLPL